MLCLVSKPIDTAAPAAADAAVCTANDAAARAHSLAANI
jgi:hypothetical protein